MATDGEPPRRPGRLPQLTPMPSPKSEGAVGRILIVDDQADVRQLLAMVLSMQRWEVETCASGAQAIELARTRKFHVAIVDLMMPAMDGMATMGALKQVAPGIEVIIATAHATVETAITAMREGAFDYLKKPFNLIELGVRLDRALEHSRHLVSLQLYETTRALMQAMIHDDVMRLSIGLAERSLRADAVGIAVRRNDTEEWRFRRTAGSPLLTDTLLAALTERLVAEGKTLVFPSPTLPEVSPAPDRRIAAALVFPLVARDRLVGVLAAVRAQHGAFFSDFDLAQGRVLVSEIALALDNECMAHDIERQRLQP